MAIDIERARVPVPVEADDGPAEPAKGGTSVLKRDLFAGSSARVGPRERMFFTERLSLLLDTGIPLHVGLESLARQASHGEMTRLTREIQEDVTSGASFAQALSSHSEVFPVTYVNLIAAAEAGGFLPIALEKLRDMEERREELRSTLVSAVSYPAVLAFFSLAVVIFVLVVVFPKFEEIFSLIHDQLPFTTRWLMAMSDFLRTWWLPLLLGMGVSTQLLLAWIRRPTGGARVDGWLLAIPGVRDIVVQLNVVQMLRVLGLSLGNGVPMVEALGSAREAVASARFRTILDRVEVGVQEGRGLSYGFEQDPLIPELVKQMIATGEESGNLPAVMARLAEFYEREWRRALGLIAKIAEPAMLLIMGCVVGLIVSSLILPIFKLSRAVH